MYRLLLAATAVLLPVQVQAESLEVRRDRLFITVAVAGERVEALLDSGAEMSVFDRETAQRLRIAGGAEVDARGTGAASARAQIVQNVAIRAMDRDLMAPMAAVMDLSDVGSRLLNRPLAMILGRELFDAGRITIDIEQGKVDWLGDEAVPRGVMLELTRSHGIETIPVQFGPSSAVPADFDLGNGSGLLISSALSEKLGLQPAGVEPSGGIGGAVPRLVVYVPDLTIAGKTFHHVRAHVVKDMEVPANVGVGILREFVIVTDFPGRRVWFDPRD